MSGLDEKRTGADLSAGEANAERLAGHAYQLVEKLAGEHWPSGLVLRGWKAAVLRGRVSAKIASKMETPLKPRQPMPERQLFEEEPDRWWNQRISYAGRYMAKRAQEPSAESTLLVVAAQHPLKDGVVPNEEFAARLDEGAQLYKQAAETGRPVEIYVPGSRHQKDGIADRVALADAGTRYLNTHHGIPVQHLHGQDWNHLFRGGSGVYNGGQEAYVAGHAFRTFPRFGSLEMVVSPGQRDRAILHLVANRVLADVVIPESLRERTDLYHSSEAQAETMLFYTFLIDPYWTGSWLADKIRRERAPNDGIDSLE